MEATEAVATVQGRDAVARDVPLDSGSPALREQIDRTHALSMELEKSVAVLAEHLDPILRPEDNAVRPKGDTVYESASSRAHSLRSANDHLAHVLVDFADLRARIDA